MITAFNAVDQIMELWFNRDLPEPSSSCYACELGCSQCGALVGHEHTANCQRLYTEMRRILAECQPRQFSHE